MYKLILGARDWQAKLAMRKCTTMTFRKTREAPCAWMHMPGAETDRDPGIEQKKGAGDMKG